jgi:hypothetical protein
MNNKVAEALALIKSGQASCVVIKNGEIVKTLNGRGIKPIVNMYDEGILCDTTVVDKVVGRASAMIMVLGGIKSCHAVLISESAKAFFETNGIALEYENICEYIVNRTRDGRCPMESAVQGIDDPKEALIAVKKKLFELSDPKN